jgi:hypothetical protein
MFASTSAHDCKRLHIAPPRYRRDGAPDCPGTADAGRDTSAPGNSDQTTSQLGRGYDALKREIERLGERLGR